MIRIDEIYHNVFYKSQQHRPRVALHYFFPSGSVKFENLCNIPAVDGVADRRLLFWDQEPLNQDLLQEFFDQFMPQYQGDLTVITSEYASARRLWLQSTYGCDTAYYFFQGWSALDWYRGYDHSFLIEPWIDRQLTRAFICANNIISGQRMHRTQFFAELVRRDLVTQNHVSFPRQCVHSGQDSLGLLEKFGIDAWQVPCLPRLIDHDRDHGAHSHCIDFFDQARQCFAHVVTETLFDVDAVHLTEKTFKAIVLEQPFLLLAPRHSLRYLRNYGFRTFDSIWDESYDEMPAQERLLAVCAICEDIQSWTATQRREAQIMIRDAVDHNKRWFYGGFQDVLWQELTDMIQSWA